MDWVTKLPPGGDRSFNACLVLVDRYSKSPMFLPCDRDDTAIMIFNRAISHTGLLQNIIIDRDINLIQPYGKISIICLAQSYHPQTNGLEERMIQTLEDMIRRFCAYGLELKHSNCFTHDWFTLIPDLELEYKKSIHSSTGNTSPLLEKIWTSRLPYETLKKELLDILPTASSFKIIFDKARHHENRYMQDTFINEKERWDKIHKPPNFKIGDLVLVLQLKDQRN
ncbi:hypothetical protein O181_013921 [Austropuccinia psidii MF-1]|uniref:Integrase catalytic domain-containing protein n=1 Tax=Austropuccinia psidii MF-1 TaxID=1389203 RepID=A0A9Q3GNP5_9BASI|nr:hypothetical protein [Austropuccinia psidii MF-1]